MAYIKPGVLITQVQESVSPTLIEPDLYAAIAGRGYYDLPQMYVHPTLWNPNAGGSSPLVALTTATLLSSIPTVSGTIDLDSIYIDAIAVSGIGQGGRKNLIYANTDTDANADVIVSANNLVFKNNASYPSVWVNYPTYSGMAFRIEIGFRVLRTDLQKTLLFEGGSDIQEAIGPVTVFNELGTAIALATASSGRKIYAYGLDGDTSVDHGEAQASFESKEIYAIAPLTKQFDQNISSWKTHATTMSTAENKKERIIISNPSIPWVGTIGSTLATDRGNTASAVYNRSAITAERRLVITHPDIVYIREKLHISRIKPSYILKTIWYNSSSYTTNCLFTDSLLLSDGTKYFKDEQITESVWTKLKSAGISELTVLVPCPGYYLSAIVAGQISGQPPEQSFTNIPLGGISRVKYSSDHFSESNLNTMAEGGVYIIQQDGADLPPYCRHQLTTDTTTVETRELSIVKSVDYTSKFLRNSMKPLIGRYNITDTFIKRVKLIINGIGLTLISKGTVRDLKILSLTQDTTNPDRLKGKVRLLTLYPANYIEIDLIY